MTRAGIPCPSEHDPGRNRRRCGIAWNKFAVRAILVNPRYTGHQVWNRQRKDEVLLDVDDVALGHTTKLRWNESARWVWSEHVVYPPVIDRETFDRVQVMIGGRATAPAGHKPHRRQHPYALRGCMWIWGVLKNYVASTAVSWPGRLRQIRSFFRARSPDQMLATAAPWTSHGYHRVTSRTSGWRLAEMTDPVSRRNG